MTVTVQQPPAPDLQAPHSVSPGETGLTASATPYGTDYQWEIVNGTITDGQGQNVVRFSAARRPIDIDGSSDVRLSVVETVAGCTTDKVTVAIPFDRRRVPQAIPFR